jgi:hypothetical protein
LDLALGYEHSQLVAPIRELLRHERQYRSFGAWPTWKGFLSFGFAKGALELSGVECMAKLESLL